MNFPPSYSAFLNLNPLPSWIYELESFQILDVNQAALIGFGYSKKEFLSLSIKDIYSNKEIPSILDTLKNINNSESLIDFGVYTHHKKNSESIQMEISGVKIVVNDYDYLVISCKEVSQNDSQFHLLNEKQKQYEAISSIGKIGYWRLTLDDQSLLWTNEVFKIWGRNQKDFELNYENFENTIHPDDLKDFRDEQNAALAEHKKLDLKYRILWPDRSIKWVHLKGRLIKEEAKIAIGYEGTVQDITSQMVVENKLKKSESNFRAIFQIASLGISKVDPSNGKILMVNSFYESITGYKADELYKLTFRELTHPDDREKDWEIFRKAIDNDENYRNEKRYIKKDGTIIWVRIHVAITRDDNGKAQRTIVICEDITERKETELRLQDISNNIPGVVFQYYLFPNGTDGLRSISKSAEVIWGYSPEVIEKDVNLVWDQIKVGGDYEQVKNSIIASINTKTKWISSYKNILPSGEVKTHLGSGTPNFLADGTVIFNSVVLDITKEVKNEELLAQATQLSRIGSWEVDLDSNKIIWSDMLHQLHGTNPSTFLLSRESILSFYRKDFHEIIFFSFINCIKTGEPFDIEIVLITTKNEEKWVRVIGQAERINSRSKRIYGSFQDIHQQKTNELVLEQSLRKLKDYQYALDQSASFTMTDSKGVIIDVNNHFCRLSQYSREELIGTTHQIINSKHHPKEFFAVFWDTIQSGKIWRGEVCNQKKDGTYYWVNTTVVPFLDKNNIPYQYLALRIDITQRKLAEEKIREAYEQLKNIAWTQSHVVRAPLARILGIINLIEAKHERLEDILFWLKHLKDASNEMDQVIRNIVNETNKFQ